MRLWRSDGSADDKSLESSMRFVLLDMGKLGLRLRAMVTGCWGDVATGRLGLRLRAPFSLASRRLTDRDSKGELGGEEKTVEPSSSNTLSMRDERRDGEWPLEDEFLLEDKLAIRPKARMALPVF